MKAAAIFAMVFVSAAPGAILLDRIAVIVGLHVVKLSDIERDLRVTQFLNRETLDLRGPEKRKAAERLVDQQLIREEFATGGYQRATDAETDAMLMDIKRSRYAGSDARYRQALAQYHLTEAEVHEQLLWQLSVLRFIDERFRTGVLASEEEIRGYYDSHTALHAAGFEAAAPQIRKTIEGERVNQQFEEWMTAERKRVRIEYKEAAFQ